MLIEVAFKILLLGGSLPGTYLPHSLKGQIFVSRWNSTLSCRTALWASHERVYPECSHEDYYNSKVVSSEIGNSHGYFIVLWNQWIVVVSQCPGMKHVLWTVCERGPVITRYTYPNTSLSCQWRLKMMNILFKTHFKNKMCMSMKWQRMPVKFKISCKFALCRIQSPTTYFGRGLAYSWILESSNKTQMNGVMSVLLSVNTLHRFDYNHTCWLPDIPRSIIIPTSHRRAISPPFFVIWSRLKEMWWLIGWHKRYLYLARSALLLHN